jgi:pyridoxal phosphate enzyme (YggS family)
MGLRERRLKFIDIAMSAIEKNFTDVKTSIKKACKDAGRAPESVELVAVSKEQPPERIAAALATGHRLFGENRVQDAETRWQPFRATTPDLKLHLIGPLQTNKVKDAIALFDCIQTIDRDSLVLELAKQLEKTPKNMEFFIQVNTGNEPQKSGVALADLPALLDLCRSHGLTITGLMCIPPLDEPAVLHFALLKKLAGQHGLPHLSIGMSADYKEAIAIGATHVRVGTALFGERS